MNSIISVFDFRRDALLKIVAWLLVFSSITGGILLSQPFYFFAVGLLGVLIFAKGGVRFSNVGVLLLLIACVISLIVNHPPSFFKAWNRLGVYTLILVVVSPLFYSDYAVSLRLKVLLYFLYIGVILSVGSFFAYFLGINLFERQGEMLEIGAGTFSGLMNHSMALGPISALSAILLFAFIVIPNGKAKKPSRKAVLISLFVFCCGACLLAASRIALVGLVLGVLVVLFVSSRDNLAKAFRMIILVLFIAGVTYPVWGRFTAFVIQKQEGNTAQGSIFYSREDKFAARIYEFRSSPIVGIGYCVADPDFTGVNVTNGRVEPGSSWLAIASMTGILGLLAFLPLCFAALIKVWKIRDTLVCGILAGMLLFFFVHMIAEGYIYAPKSCFSLLFWLIISSIYGITIFEEKGYLFKI